MLHDGRLFGRTARHFTLQWHLTHACHERCRHCYDRSALEPLDFTSALAVLAELGRFCERRGVTGGVSFTGGDPWLYPRFLEVYAAALEHGFEVSVLANPVGEEALAALVAIRRPRYYQVSLEGCEATNDAIRGRGHYARVMAFLDLLRAARVRAHVMLTLHRENLGDAERLAEALAGKVDRFLYNRLAQVGEGAQLEQPTREEYVAFARRWLLLAKQHPFVGLKDNLLNIPLHHFGKKLSGGCTGAGCGAAFNFLALLPDGEVHACRKLPSPLGNVRQRSLDAIYDSEAAARYRVGSRACALCEIRNRCGGCLAVTWGTGRDPFEARDPHCFFSERRAVIAAAARSAEGAARDDQVGDGRRGERAVERLPQARVERSPLLQLRKNRPLRVPFQEVRPVTPLGGQAREPSGEHVSGDVQEEDLRALAEQAPRVPGQDAAGARGDDRLRARQGLAQEGAFAHPVHADTALGDERRDRPEARFDERVHVEVLAPQALGQQGAHRGLAGAGEADQHHVSPLGRERAHGSRLLRAAGPAPPLLVLELTRRCGRQCEVCFHRDMRSSSLARADMPLALARHAIRGAAESGVRAVRLTGGEPLRHASFATLLREIRDAGLEAWVNTAGLPEGGTPWQLLGSVASDVLLPLRSREQRAEIAAGVRAIRRGGPARVRLGVVLSREHVAELPEVVALARELDCPLEAYRVMSVPGHVPGSSPDELCHALAVLARANRHFPPSARARVANAVPFCVSEDERLTRDNCFGACFDDGRNRLVVSPEGELRPSYSLRSSLGNLADTPIAAAWQHPALLALHDAERLPVACRTCRERDVCCGGSRYEAWLATGSLFGMDPLALHVR